MTREIEEQLKQARLTTSSELNQHVLNDAFAVLPTVTDESQTIPLTQRIFTMKRIRRSAVAAVIILGFASLFTWFSPGNGGASVVFADVIENVRQLRTVTYSFRDLDGRAQVNTMVREPGQVRMEFRQFDQPKQVIAIIDFNQNKALVLEDKQARIMTFESKQAEALLKYRKWITEFRSLEVEAEQIPGHKEIDGQKVVGFRVTREMLPKEFNTFPRNHWTVWVNPKTSLPVQVELADEEDGEPKDVLSDFRFDIDLDDSLFSLTPPEGYEVVNITK